MKITYTQAALIADSLSLGPHWVYDQDKLIETYPDGISSFSDPLSSYHPNRKAGQFTHFGDQTYLLQKSIENAQGFSIESWRQDWTFGMRTYDGYIDGATKNTLANDSQKPSDSNDLSGASRIAPVLDLNLDLDEAIVAARAQTELTHGSKDVSDAAEFFTRACYLLQSGESIESALIKASSSGRYPSLRVAEKLDSVLNESSDDFRSVGIDMGLSCSIANAFPLTLYFALRFKGDFLQSISDNAMAGGDSSARAMLLAVLFVPLLKQDEKEKLDFLYDAIELPHII